MNLFGGNNGMSGGSGSTMFSGGLFGQRNNTGGGTGMFGSSGGTGMQSGGGMFGGMNQQKTGTSMFGGILGNQGGNQGGSGGLFGAMGGGNQQQQGMSGGLFGAMGGGGQTTGGNIFGGGMGGGTMGGGQTQGIFGGGGNSGFGGGNNFLKGGSTGMGGGGGLGGLGGLSGLGGMGNKGPGTLAYTFNQSSMPKNKDGMYLASVTGVQAYKDRSLDELRIEDYVAFKSKQIPDNVMSHLQAAWTKNAQGGSGNMIGGGGGLGIGQGSSGGTLFGGGNTGGSVFGGGQTQGAGIFGQSGGGIGGMGGQSGNLFGAKPQGTGTGMFGTGGGLGGGTGGNLFAQKGASTGGIFGGGTGGNTGSLFGGGGGTQTGGNLFGGGGGIGGGMGGGMGGGTGSLFGGGSGTQTGSLFGGGSALGQNKPATGSLFGGGTSGTNAGQSGGLFGGSKPGGLFTGGSTLGTGGTGSALLGGGTGSSLFGGGTTLGAQKPGGLFGGTGIGTGTGGALFSGGGATGGGLFGGAGATGQAQQQQQVGLGMDPQQLQMLMLLNNSTAGLASSKYNLFGKTIGSKEKQNELYEKYETGRESLLTSVMKKNSKAPYNPFDKPASARKSYSEMNSDFDAKLSLRSKITTSKKKEDSISLMGRKYEPDYFERDVLFRDGYGEVSKKLLVNSYSQDKSMEKRASGISRVNDSVRVFISFNNEGEERTFSVDAKLLSTCLDIKKTILKLVFDSTYLNYTKYKLLYKNKMLSDNSKVKDVGLRDNDKIYLILDAEAEDDDNLSSSMLAKDQLAPESLLPKLTKNYLTEPSMIRISRMTQEELRNVENFSIYNDEVKVTFIDKVDITGLDLDEIVSLGHRSVEIYPENGTVPLPKDGQGLNRAAIIEFYKWAIPKKYTNDIESYKMKLKSWSESQSAEFKFYDADREIVCIQVENFNVKE